MKKIFKRMWPLVILLIILIVYLYVDYRVYKIDEENLEGKYHSAQKDLAKFADSNKVQIKLVYNNTQIIVQKNDSTRLLERKINILNNKILYQNLSADSLKLMQKELFVLLDSLKQIYYKEVIEGYIPTTISCSRAIRGIKQKIIAKRITIDSLRNRIITAEIIKYEALLENNNLSNYCSDIRKLRIELSFSDCLPQGRRLYVIIKTPDGQNINGTTVSETVRYKGSTITPAAVINHIERGNSTHTIAGLYLNQSGFYPIDIVNENGNSILLFPFNFECQ